MPLNNPDLFNAVIAGIGGSSQQAWLTDPNAVDYLAFANGVAAVASAVDTQIPSIVGGPSAAQKQVLQSIASGVFGNRVPKVGANYTSIAAAISALFIELTTKLQPAGPSAAALLAGSYAITVPLVINFDNIFVQVGPGNVDVGASSAVDKWVCFLNLDVQKGTDSSVAYRVSYSADGGAKVAAPGATTNVVLQALPVENQITLQVVITGAVALNNLGFFVETQGGETVANAQTIDRLSLIVFKA
jgi:hypothetical protein